MLIIWFSEEGNMILCECTDSGCPIHKGIAECHVQADVTLFRVDMDMEDDTPVIVCNGCAEDMVDSGLFYNVEERWDSEYP
jgi:hypothetical protein